MNKRFSAFIILLLSAAIFIILPALAHPETTLKNLFGGVSEETALKVTSPYEVDYKNGIMTFSFPGESTKRVHATYNDLKIDCKRIEIYYQKKSEKKSENKDQSGLEEINKIVIKGGVRITPSDGSSAFFVSADEIIYTGADEKAVMTGNPAELSYNMAEGRKITAKRQAAINEKDNSNNYNINAKGARIIFDLKNDKYSVEDENTGTSEFLLSPNESKGK